MMLCYCYFLKSMSLKPPGWVEPLLQRIKNSPSAVPYPNIEIIRDQTFQVGCTIAGSRAIFRWKDLTCQWEFVPDYERKRRKQDCDPIRWRSCTRGFYPFHEGYLTSESRGSFLWIDVMVISRGSFHEGRLMVLLFSRGAIFTRITNTLKCIITHVDNTNSLHLYYFQEQHHTCTHRGQSELCVVIITHLTPNPYTNITPTLKLPNY